MITEGTAREIALSMPEAEEREHMNHPDFRVRNKIFATLWPSKTEAVVMVDPAEVDPLIDEQPKVFSRNGWSEKYGALTVDLDQIEEAQFRVLIRKSWLRKAPKNLAAELQSES